MSQSLSEKLTAKSFLRRYKALTTLMVILFITSVFLLSVTLAHVLKLHARHNLLAQQADMLLETMSSVQAYTSDQIRPSLANQIERKFLPASVPSYSAQQVFEQLRQRSNYGDFSYKQAVLNPTNLRDKADVFEATLIEQYRSGEVLPQNPIQGQHTTDKGTFFYEAKAISVYKPSCLKCHSTPDVAPQSMVQHYGSDNGFGWELNEIVGAQIIYLPLDTLRRSNRSLLYKIMAIVLTALAGILLVLRRWLKPA